MIIALGKAILIACMAGFISALLPAIIFSISAPDEFLMVALPRYLLLGIYGSILVGLPIAFFVFFQVRDDREFGPKKLLLVANGAAAILTALLGLANGWLGVIFFGIPTLLAANIFAVAGWLMILRQYRINQHA